MLIKRGKREAREVTPSAAGKKMKRTLLLTYFTTLASLVLCCAMFLGTTMAWFSSDVTNTGNVIQVGTLAAELYHVVPADGANPGQEVLLNGNEGYQVFDLAKWSPTTLQTQKLKLVNRGDLDFKYDLSLLLTSTAGVGAEGQALTLEQQQALLSSFEVYVKLGSEETVISDGEIDWTEWTSCGTLDSFLNTEAPAAEGSTENGEVVPSDAGMFKEILLHSGALKPNVTIEAGTATQDSVQIITIAIKMADTESTDLMGQSFTISVKLAATQITAGETVGE